MFSARSASSHACAASGLVVPVRLGVGIGRRRAHRVRGQGAQHRPRIPVPGVGGHRRCAVDPILLGGAGGQPPPQHPGSAVRAAAKLLSSDDLSLQRAAGPLRLDLDGPLRSAWDREGHISFGELWGYYATYPYLARLRDRSVLAEGVRSVLDTELLWHDTGFALATGWDGGRYTGLVLPGTTTNAPEITDSLLIVQPERATAQQRADAERSRGEDPNAELSSGTHTTRNDASNLTHSPPDHLPAHPMLTRFYGVKELNPERYAGDFSKLAQEVVAHLAAVDGVQLEVRVEITARAPADSAKPKSER